MGGENNLNLAVIYKGDEFIVQISAQRESVQHAIDILEKDSTIQFVADRGATHTMKDIEKSETLSYMQSSATSSPVGVLSIVEKLESSLEKEVADNKSADRKKSVRVGAAKEIDFTMNVGTQLTTIFSTLAGKDLVWTDCKPGNLLVRKDNDAGSQLVIADVKAITPISELPTRGSGALCLDSLITDQFLSEKGKEKLFELASSKIKPEVASEIPVRVKAIMEKEYSYQLAVVLYYAATGKEVLNDDFKKNNGFDFSADAFKTQEGQKLQSIIEHLSVPEPGQRMHYNDAGRLLAVLDNDKAYKAVSAKISATPANPSIGSSAMLSTVMAGGRAAAVGHLKRQASAIELAKHAVPEPDGKENISPTNPQAAATAAPVVDDEPKPVGRSIKR